MTHKRKRNTFFPKAVRRGIFAKRQRKPRDFRIKDANIEGMKPF